MSNSTSVVQSAWDRIFAALGERASDICLRPGGSPPQFQSFEQWIGHSLPRDVREWWTIHDGQSPAAIVPILPGLFWLPLLNPRVPSALGMWRLAKGQFQERAIPAFPLDTVRSSWQCGWIPIFRDSHSNFVGVDLDPGFNGVTGEVIAFGPHAIENVVLARNWARFLNDIVDELEAGRLRQLNDRTAMWRNGSTERELTSAWRDWASLKLDAELLSSQAAPTSGEDVPVVTGFAAEKAKNVVEELTAAIYQFELRWLLRRPLKSLGLVELSEDENGYGSATGSEAGGDRRTWRIGEFYSAAIAELSELQERYCTHNVPNPRLFRQQDPPQYRPERQRVVEIRQMSRDHLIAVLPAWGTAIRRFHLRDFGAGWRIDECEIFDPSLRKTFPQMAPRQGTPTGLLS